MAALVLKEWKTSDKPLDKSGNYIMIRGRQPGLVAFLLAHVGVDPTTSLKVNATRIEFSRASLALFALILSTGIALLKYFLGRTLALGFVEQSGAVSSMQFKRSVVEGMEVNEQQARYICEVTQFLIESAQRRLPR